MNDSLHARRVQEARLLLIEAAERLEDPRQVPVAAALARASVHQLGRVERDAGAQQPSELPPAMAWFG